MFLFKCTVSLAILCGVNSYHCARDCDKDGLIPTRHTIPILYPYKSLINCSYDTTHCSNCTPGTGHKLYDNITELVPLEQCYSICFSNVTPSVENDTNRRRLFKTNVFAEDLCTSNLKEAFVCFSACLFTLRRNNVVREIVRKKHYHLPSNATCTDFCTVPGGICDRALGPDVSANCTEDCQTHLCPSSCKNIQNNINLLTGSVSGFGGSGSDLRLDFAEDVALRKRGVMEIFATYKEPLPKAYGLIWRVTYVVGDLKKQYIPQHLPLFLLKREVGPLYRAGSNLFAIRELQCKSGKLEYALVDDQGVGRFTTVQDRQCFYGSWFPRPPRNISVDVRFQQSTGELFAQFKADEFSLDSQYVEEYRVQVFSGSNSDPFSKSCQEYDFGTPFGDKAFQIENNSLVARIETTREVISWFPNIIEECDSTYTYFVVVYATTQNATSCSEHPLGDEYQLTVPFPDYQLISFNYYTHTFVWDIVTGEANVSVYMNVTSHWTSLTILKGFRGELVVGTIHTYFSQPNVIPVVPTKKNYVFVYPYVSIYNMLPHMKRRAYIRIDYDYRYVYKVQYQGYEYPINIPINSIHYSSHIARPNQDRLDL